MQKTPAIVNLLDKVTNHAFRNVEIRDDPIAKGPHRNYAGGRFAEHALGFRSNCQDVPRILFDGYDGGLSQHDPLTFDIHQGIGRSQVNPHVIAE
jgi:hypothetical protein